MSRRVVVTGVGLVCPLGAGLATSLAALAARGSAVGAATLFDPAAIGDYPVAEVRDLDGRAWFTPSKAIKLANRATRFAVAAARMAVAHAGWTGPLEEVGVVLGAGGSDLQITDLARALGGPAPSSASRPSSRAEGEDGEAVPSVLDIAFFADRMLAGLTPLWLLVNLPNMSAAHVSIQLGASGPNSTVMTDWIAGSQAVGEAFEWIRAGEADAVLAGGAESGVVPFAIADYEQAGLLHAGIGAREQRPAAAGSARPDTARRQESNSPNGFALAEGAAVFLLESQAHAERRGARALAEVKAYRSSSAPVGPLPGSEEALVRTMRQALNDAAWQPRDVRTLVPASIPVTAYEAAEEAALRDVFGDDAGYERLVFRDAVGHALSAAGSIDLALALGSARTAGPMMCNAMGFSGQVVTLGVLFDAPGPPAGAISE